MLSLCRGVNENPLSQTLTKLARRAMAEHGAQHPPRCAVHVLQASCPSSMEHMPEYTGYTLTIHI